MMADRRSPFEGGYVFEEYAKSGNGLMNPKEFLCLFRREFMKKVGPIAVRTGDKDRNCKSFVIDSDEMKRQQCQFEAGRLFSRFDKAKQGNLGMEEFLDILGSMSVNTLTDCDAANISSLGKSECKTTKSFQHREKRSPLLSGSLSEIQNQRQRRDISSGANHLLLRPHGNLVPASPKMNHRLQVNTRELPETPPREVCGTRPNSQNVLRNLKNKRVTFADYLHLEMTGTMDRSSVPDAEAALGWEEQELITSVVKTPFFVEGLMLYGFVLAMDSFLAVFTYLPLRAIWAFFLLCAKLMTWPISQWYPRAHMDYFSRQHIYILLRTMTMLIAAWSIGFMDMSRAYHYIKMLSFMKLYMIFNLLDIIDKLLTALGQDIFDSLHWSTQNRPFERKLRIVFNTIGASLYAVLHGALTFARLVSLNVAINSKGSALLTLLISNNFIELKSSVFKRFQAENLFQISCADIVERFVMVLFLILIGTEGLRRNYDFEHYLHSVAVILCCEVGVDWIKHAFITKFNHMDLEVYAQFKAVLRHDLTSSRTRSQRKVLDHTHILSRRLGLPNIPLACVSLRIIYLHVSDRTWTYSTWQSMTILGLGFCCILALKTLLGLCLLVHSTLQLQAEGYRVQDRTDGTYSPTAVSTHCSLQSRIVVINVFLHFFLYSSPSLCVQFPSNRISFSFLTLL